MSSAEVIFKKTFALAAVAALLLLSQPAAARQQQKEPFTISSLGTPFGVQVKFEGTYTVHETYVEVSVERAFIYVSEHCPYQGRRFVNTISIGLAALNPDGRWDTESRSLPLHVERVLSPREEYRLAGLSFQIPRGEGVDMSKRWLVVETEETAIDLPDQERDEKGYAIAHSCRSIFARPCPETGR